MINTIFTHGVETVKIEKNAKDIDIHIFYEDGSHTDITCFGNHEINLENLNESIANVSE